MASGSLDVQPFNAIEEFKGAYRCLAMDPRNQRRHCSGPLEIERPWEGFADDQLGLMDHPAFDKFLVMGFCIDGRLIWNPLRKAPDRIVAYDVCAPPGPKIGC